jgi:hypothetical protein
LRAQPVARTFQNLGGRLVAIAEFARPMLSDEVETAQTIALMDELASRDAPHRLVIAATHRAIEDAGLTLDAGDFEKTCAVYWFLKRTIRMVPTPGTNPLVDQTLIPPASLLAMSDPEGDCPQFSMLATAMLTVLCIPSWFKTIAADPEYPRTFSHVYNVVDVDGQIMPFDSSHGPEPGAEYGRRFKEKVWPAIACDRCKEKKMLRNQAAIPQFRNRVLRRSMALGDLKPFSHLYMTLNGGRLGQDYDDSSDLGLPTVSSGPALPVYTTYDTEDNPNLMTGPNPSAGELAAAGFPLASSTTLAPGVAAGSSGANGYSLAASALQDATALAAPVVKAATTMQPYYTTNPATGTTQLYNPNTGTFVGSSISSMLSSLSPTTLLIGAGLVLVLMMSGKK